MTTPIWGNKHFDTLRRSKCPYNGVNNDGYVLATYTSKGYPLGISSDGILYALDNYKLNAIDTANGNLYWSFDLPDTFAVGFSEVYNMCLSIDSSGNLYFLTKTTPYGFTYYAYEQCTSLTKEGVLRWTFNFDAGYGVYQNGGGTYGSQSNYALVISETLNTTYIVVTGIDAVPDGKIYAINNLDGSQDWVQNISWEDSTASLSLLDGAVPKLFLSGYDGTLCFEDNSGYSELWRYAQDHYSTSIEGKNSKIDSNGNVYTLMTTKIGYQFFSYLTCINNGAKVWENTDYDFSNPSLSIPLIIDETNNALYFLLVSVGYTYNKILKINLTTGVTISEKDISGSNINFGTNFWEFDNVFLTDDGYIYISLEKKIAKINTTGFIVDSFIEYTNMLPNSPSVMDSNGNIYVNSTDGVLKIGNNPFAYEPANVYSVAVSQNHNNLVPFQFIAENGFEDSSRLSFVISTDSGEGLFSSNTTTTTIVSDTYVPETIDSKYKHNPYAYVDIISGDESGIKEINTRIENEIYSYKTPTSFFNIPKFTWSNDFFEEESETSDNDSGILWVGTNDKTLNRVYYNKFFAQNVATANFTSDVTSEVYKIHFSPINSDMYVSGYDHLAKYSVNNYVDGTKATKSIEISNVDNDIIVYSNSSNVISVQSYLGNVVARDRLTLSVVNTYSGFDAPFKVIKSAYHNCYFVAGTYSLWKLFYNGTKQSVYNIKGYKIIDVDCTENGQICLLLDNGSESIIRILDKDIYSIIKEKRSSEDKVRFCKYCSNKKFYIICESYNKISLLVYNSIHYVMDVKTKTLDRYSFETNIVTTTTTTTQTAPTQKIEIIKPNGDEIIEKGSNYNITWKTTESISDLIAIELYKNNKVFDVISSANINTGQYSWLVPTSYESDSTYQVKITWLNATNGFSDISDSSFSILSNNETTTTTTEVSEYLFTCIGVEYDSYNNFVIIVMNTGLLGIFDLTTNSFYGVFDFGVINVNAMGLKDGYVKTYPGNTKIRIFVGTEVYLNDKWDSGEVETELTSIYYGGGNNLIPGEKYYVNLQVYSEEYGWSEVQTQEWIMPK